MTEPTLRDPRQPIPGLPKHHDPRWVLNADLALSKMHLPNADFSSPEAMFTNPHTHGSVDGWAFASSKYVARVAPKQQKTPAPLVAIGYYLEAPFEPACEYLMGVAYGIKCFIAQVNNQMRPIRATDREAILELMLKNADKVHAMRSLPEFYDWLKSKLGNRAGTLKRVEKICQDIGKTFSPPGRPRLK